MKVLVISHNVFCMNTNMGKTLSAYFSGWAKDDIAQLYVHAETPTGEVCENYYRITDKDAIKSIITRRCGTIYTGAAQPDISAQNRSRVTAALYQKGKSRTPAIYIARDLWWKLSAWKSKKLLDWVDGFDPDVIFLASGDYGFIYRIALELAKYKNIPLAVSCMDDYYFYNKNKNRFLGKTVHRGFLKQVRKTMDYASCIFSICEKMSADYGRLFGKPCHTLHTPSTVKSGRGFDKKTGISYMGNLGFKRNEQLVKLGKALKSIDCPNKPEYIDVYSMETREELLKDLNLSNGIMFHGGIPPQQVPEVMGKSMAVIHTESFDKDARKAVLYSVSTKIADSLASGTCILAYGPAEVASMEYLQSNRAAFCITDDEQLEAALIRFLTDEALREQIADNALALARKNHDGANNRRLIKDGLAAICEK